METFSNSEALLIMKVSFGVEFDFRGRVCFLSLVPASSSQDRVLLFGDVVDKLF